MSETHIMTYYNDSTKQQTTLMLDEIADIKN